MKIFTSLSFFIMIFIQISGFCSAKNSMLLDGFQFVESDDNYEIKEMHFDFKGYSNHWEEYSWTWFFHDGLFLSSQTDILSDVIKAECDIGNLLLLDELWIQKGFIDRLPDSLKILYSTDERELKSCLEIQDVLLIANDRNPVMKTLLTKLPQKYQFRRNRAFYLSSGEKTLFIISCHTDREKDLLYEHIIKAKEITNKYSLYKGMPGCNTNYMTITPAYRENPFSLINKSLQTGCSWVTVCGYNDFMIPGPVNEALSEIDFPFLFLSGQTGEGGVMYGMDEYPNIQNNSIESCLDWTEKNNGLYFRNMNGASDEYADRYTGYIVTNSNHQAAFDTLNTPFITFAGNIGMNVPPSMVVFLDKSATLNKHTLLQAIKEQKNVAVFGPSAMVGAKDLREALMILFLEKAWLQNQLSANVTVDAKIVDYQLCVSLLNRTNELTSGQLVIKAPAGLIFGNNAEKLSLTLNPGEKREIILPINCSAGACGRDNPIGFVFETSNGWSRAMTHYSIPNTVEIHSIIGESAGNIQYPLTIYNYSAKDPIVDIKVFSAESNQLVFQKQMPLCVSQWNKFKTHVALNLKKGDYKVQVNALGNTAEGKLLVYKNKGKASVHEEDVNNDGIPEIVLENNKIRSTIILEGGRVIKYTVKDRNENLLFKLWPEKPPWDGKPVGMRSFYPYGGLDEFVGYPNMSGHIIYQYEILKDKGDYVRVKVWANMHDSKIEKIITLFADSELLEVRYAFDDMASNLNIIGINPIIEIGPSTGPEDVYYFPADNLESRRPELDRYYGDYFFLKEGWVAGYDTDMDISLIVGYPVNDAIMMHMWNNHPNNTPTPYYYTELQPWLSLKHGTTTYFTYYFLGQDGNWKKALDKFKKHKLVTYVE